MDQFSKLFLFFIIYFMCMDVSHARCPGRPEEGIGLPRDGTCRQLRVPGWVLGTETGSSVRASTFNP